MPQQNPFGTYLREVRLAEKRSLRLVARELGISHVYLSEVERGLMLPLLEKHWDTLLQVLPSLSRDKLAQHAQESRYTRVEFPWEYRELARALETACNRRSLTPEGVSQMLALL